MKNFRYYYGSQADQFNFIRIPKLLLTERIFESLSLNAKVLYGVLLDRMSLSRKNGWLDGEKRVYIIYQIGEIQEDLRITRKKAIDLLAELEKFGLLEKKRRGHGLPNILYVKNFMPEPDEVPEGSAAEGLAKASLENTAFAPRSPAFGTSWPNVPVPGNPSLPVPASAAAGSARTAGAIVLHGEKAFEACSSRFGTSGYGVHSPSEAPGAVFADGKSQINEEGNEKEKKQRAIRPGFCPEATGNAVPLSGNGGAYSSIEGHHDARSSAFVTSCTIPAAVGCADDGASDNRKRDSSGSETGISGLSRTAPEVPKPAFQEVPESALQEVRKPELQEVPESAFQEVPNPELLKSKTEDNNTEMNQIESNHIKSNHLVSPPGQGRQENGMGRDKMRFDVMGLDGMRCETDPLPITEQYRSLICENISYSELLSENPYDRELVEGVLDLILETVLSGAKSIVIASSPYPSELVKSKFLKLNYWHIQYVIRCLHDNTTKIRNIKKYLLTVLFNAPSTIDGYYLAEVNHDMGGEAAGS